MWLNVGGLIYLVLSMISIKREHQNQWTMRHCYSDNTWRKNSTVQSFRVFAKRLGILSLRLILLYSVSSIHWKPIHKVCHPHYSFQLMQTKWCTWTTHAQPRTHHFQYSLTLCFILVLAVVQMRYILSSQPSGDTLEPQLQIDSKQGLAQKLMRMP